MKCKCSITHTFKLHLGLELCISKSVGALEWQLPLHLVRLSSTTLHLFAHFLISQRLDGIRQCQDDDVKETTSIFYIVDKLYSLCAWYDNNSWELTFTCTAKSLSWSLDRKSKNYVSKRNRGRNIYPGHASGVGWQNHLILIQSQVCQNMLYNEYFIMHKWGN